MTAGAPRRPADGADLRSVVQVALAAGALGLAARAVLRRVRALDLRGKTAIVTGGSRGLGLLVARELGRAGCRLVVCARDPVELERATAELRREADVLGVPCDVSDAAQVERLVHEAVRRFGHVDVLVNNAGQIDVGPLETMTVEEFRRALDVMFWGVVHPTLTVLPHFRARRGGRIVNITSIGGKLSVPHLLPYSCAKFAAVGFSEGLRAELGREGITVVTVVPGLMRTGSHVNARFKGRQEAEYTWFALGATLPLLSMDAERAARAIVRALRRGDAEVTLSLPAKLAARLHGLFPGLGADVLALANRLLPPPNGGQARAVRGRDLQRGVEWLARLGERAVRKYQFAAR